MNDGLIRITFDEQSLLYCLKNVGLQKSIFQYDKKTYDQDGFENENIDEVNTEVDINQVDSNDDEAIEAIDINHLGTNFTDGAFYEEDQEMDE